MSGYDYPDSAEHFTHHPGLQGVRRKVTPRRVVPQQQHIHPAHGGPQAHYAEPGYASQMAAHDPYAQQQFAQPQPAAPQYYAEDPGYAPVDPVPAQAAVQSSPVYYLGALLSLGLVAAAGVWGYQLAMRDVNGIPVVRALETEGRIQPTDPGGRQAAHQGLAVNEVQANGEATAAADQLILAPPPIDLLDGDQPVAAIVQASISTAPASRNSIEIAVANAVSQVEGQATIAENTEGRIPASVPGVSRSPVPGLRPALDLNSYNRQPVEVAAATDAAAVQLAAAASVDADPSSIVPGTFLVQLGAFDSEDIARSQWDSISARYGDFFEGKQRVVQISSRGGRDFYRLRAAGFSTMSDARQFCSEVIARSGNCIPVVVR